MLAAAWRAAWPLSIAALAACIPTPTVPPFTSAAETAHLDSNESRVWHQAAEFDEALAASGQVHDDPALRDYLQSIMDRLYPEFRGALRVQVVNAPVLNAFCLPNGSIYVNTGMIAASENEAQLATVLAHEGAHFMHRDGFRATKQVKNVALLATASNMAGIPVVGDIVAMSSMFGYSRDLEREADEAGFQRLRQAGYDVAQSPRAFERLLAEVQAYDIEQPFFFSTHPALQERIDSYNALIPTSGGGGRVAREEYEQQTRGAYLYAIEESLVRSRFPTVILAFQADDVRARLPPYADYYLGEAYRLRGQAGDEELSLSAYLEAREQAPDYAPVYRALGRLNLKRGDRVLARQCLERYLQLAPGAADRAYIEQTLRDLGP